MMREPVDSLKQHEQERLLKTSTEDSIEKDHHQIEEISEGIDPSPPPSHVRQWVLVITVSTLWILVLIVETFLFSFYPGIAKMKGLSHTSIGAVFTAYEITRFAANPICGSMISVWNPKSMSVTGAVLSAVTTAAFGLGIRLDGNYFLVTCIIVRLTAGAARGMVMVACTTVLLKSTSYSTSFMISIIEMVDSIGYIVGPAFGSALFQVGGYEFAFWMLAGLVLASILPYCILISEIKEDTKAVYNFLDVMKIPGISMMFAHNVVAKIISITIVTQLGIYLTENFASSSSTVSIVYAVNMLWCVILCPVASRIVNKGYLYSMMLFGWFSYIPLLLLFNPSPLLDFIFHGKRYFWLTTITHGVMLAISPTFWVPPFQACLDVAEVNGHDANSAHTFGMIAGYLHAGRGLGAILGPVTVGALTDKIDLPWAMTVLSGLNTVFLAAMILFLALMKVYKKQLKIEKNGSLKDANKKAATFISEKLIRLFTKSTTDETLCKKTRDNSE